jgi:hypothetical protein
MKEGAHMVFLKNQDASSYVNPEPYSSTLEDFESEDHSFYFIVLYHMNNNTIKGV